MKKKTVPTATTTRMTTAPVDDGLEVGRCPRARYLYPTPTTQPYKKREKKESIAID